MKDFSFDKVFLRCLRSPGFVVEIANDPIGGKRRLRKEPSSPAILAKSREA